MDDIDLLIYTPASFVCDKCGFALEKRSMCFATGTLGVPKEGYEPEACPNDGDILRRVTWKEAYGNAATNNHEMAIALAESVKLQSHYAKLLNMYDGGTRSTFSCFGEWIQRLVETGKIKREDAGTV